MNLLILAVMRLKRALQRVHPPTIRPGKTHAELYRTIACPSSQPIAPAARLRLGLFLYFLGQGRDNHCPHTIWQRGYLRLSKLRATFARLSSNMAIHKSTHRIQPVYPILWIHIHSFSPRWQDVIQKSTHLFPKSRGTLGTHCPLPVDNSPVLCYDESCSPSTSAIRWK